MKTYVKPELYYEHFELSQHIAACMLRLNLGSVETCSATANPVSDGLAYFVSEGICTPGTADTGIYCYFNGSVSNTTFMS